MVRRQHTAGVAQLVERHVANVVVVGSSPITRFRKSLNNKDLRATNLIPFLIFFSDTFFDTFFSWRYSWRVLIYPSDFLIFPFAFALSAS